MALLIVYVALVFVGEFFAVLLGLFLDELTPTFSMPIALSLFFLVLVLAWPLSVYMTDRWIPEKS